MTFNHAPINIPKYSSVQCKYKYDMQINFYPKKDPQNQCWRVNLFQFGVFGKGFARLGASRYGSTERTSKWMTCRSSLWSRPGYSFSGCCWLTSSLSPIFHNRIIGSVRNAVNTRQTRNSWLSEEQKEGRGGCLQRRKNYRRMFFSLSSQSCPLFKHQGRAGFSTFLWTQYARHAVVLSGTRAGRWSRSRCATGQPREETGSNQPVTFFFVGGQRCSERSSFLDHFLNICLNCSAIFGSFFQNINIF